MINPPEITDQDFLSCYKVLALLDDALKEDWLLNEKENLQEYMISESTASEMADDLLATFPAEALICCGHGHMVNVSNFINMLHKLKLYNLVDIVKKEACKHGIVNENR